MDWQQKWRNQYLPLFQSFARHCLRVESAASMANCTLFVLADEIDAVRVGQCPHYFWHSNCYCCCYYCWCCSHRCCRVQPDQCHWPICCIPNDRCHDFSDRLCWMVCSRAWGMHECRWCSSVRAAAHRVRSSSAVDRSIDGCDCSHQVFPPSMVSCDDRAQSRAYIQLFVPPV